MIVRFADNLDRKNINELVNRLEAENFAEACIIFSYDSRSKPDGQSEEQMLYIRLPASQHGVVLNVDSIDVGVIDWAIEALRLSVR